jgi:acyl carrier protein
VAVTSLQLLSDQDQDHPEMPNQDQITDAVFDHLAKTSGVAASDLSLLTRLDGTGLGLDSIACLELLLSVEASTGLRMRSEALTSDAFRTIGSFVDYVAASRDA